MLVAERCQHVPISTQPDHALWEAAGRRPCSQTGALPADQQQRLVGILPSGAWSPRWPRAPTPHHHRRA